MFIFYKCCFEGEDIKIQFPLREKELGEAGDVVVVVAAVAAEEEAVVMVVVVIEVILIRDTEGSRRRNS